MYVCSVTYLCSETDSDSDGTYRCSDTDPDSDDSEDLALNKRNLRRLSLADTLPIGIVRQVQVQAATKGNRGKTANDSDAADKDSLKRPRPPSNSPLAKTAVRAPCKGAKAGGSTAIRRLKVPMDDAGNKKKGLDAQRLGRYVLRVIHGGKAGPTWM